MPSQKRAIPPKKEDPKKPSLYEGQRRRALANAERDELATRKLKGELVERKAVDKMLFTLSRAVRDGLENIPDRIAPLVAAEMDQGRCHGIIRREIQEALEALTRC